MGLEEIMQGLNGGSESDPNEPAPNGEEAPQEPTDPPANEGVDSNTDVAALKMSGQLMTEPDPRDYQGPPKMIDLDYTTMSHTDQARINSSAGIYLDDVKRIEAEKVRAAIEGREPDLVNPPSYGGDVLKPTLDAAKTLPGDYSIPVSSVQTIEVGSPVDSEDEPESEDTEPEEPTE